MSIGQALLRYNFAMRLGPVPGTSSLGQLCLAQPQPRQPERRREEVNDAAQHPVLQPVRGRRRRRAARAQQRRVTQQRADLVSSK